MPRILSKYIVRQTLPWVLLALLGSVLVFVVTQLVRIAPLFIGHGAGAGQTVLALLLLVVPVAGWALTPALSIALFAIGGRMARDGELTVLDAAGFRRSRVISGPVALTLVITLLSAWIWLDAAPRSQRRLRSLAVSLLGGSLSRQIVPGRFYRKIPGVTFYAEAIREDGSFDGVFIETVDERGRSIQALATSGRISALTDALDVTVHLEKGTAFMGGKQAGAVDDAALSFEHLTLRLPLAAEIERRLDFLPRSQAVSTAGLLGPSPPGIPVARWRFAFWRRIAGPIGALLLSLLSIYLAFTPRWRSRGAAVGVAVLLFVSFHILGRFSETLLDSGSLSSEGAAFLPAAAVGLVLLLFLFIPSRRLKRRGPPQKRLETPEKREEKRKGMN